MKRFVLLVLTCLALTFVAYSKIVCTKSVGSRLRTGPSIKSHISQDLPKYSPLEVIDSKGEWLQVKGISYQGWIHQSLISSEYLCMLIKSPEFSHCSKSTLGIKRPLSFHEGFKILEQDFGCNFVEDRWGKKMWIRNTNIWPESTAKLIKIKTTKEKEDQVSFESVID